LEIESYPFGYSTNKIIIYWYFLI